MTGRTPNAYFESSVLSADPVELTAMLYGGAIAAVEDARRHLAAGDIPSRSRSITRAHEILTELLTSLNHEAGGDFSRRLAQLYDYIMHLLLDANIKQADAPLGEAQSLLNTLAEGWRGLQAARTAAPVETATMPAAPEEPAPVDVSPWQSGYGAEHYSNSHSWSL